MCFSEFLAENGTIDTIERDEERIKEVYNYLKNGTNKANEYANKTLNEVKMAMGINYFNDDNFIKEQINKYN